MQHIGTETYFAGKDSTNWAKIVQFVLTMLIVLASKTCVLFARIYKLNKNKRLSLLVTCSSS